MISVKIFILVSIILYIGMYIYLDKNKINIFVGIILIGFFAGSYGIVMKGGKLIEDLHLERSDDLEFIAMIFGILFVFLFGTKMKFKK